jgi:hypothetical protein
MDKDLQERIKLVPLGYWIDLADAAGVPFVPALFSPLFPVEQIYKLVDGDAAPELQAALAWLEERKRRWAGLKFSCRWECCSSMDAKYAASKGAEWSNAFTGLICDDPRIDDCTVGEQTRVCIRPWIEAVRYDGFPVEFRVYAGPDGIQGVSSYYPQRALSEEFIPHAEECRRLCERLMECRHFPVGFTADFILSHRGLVLLEGGPPHMFGPVSAHPCCFPPGKIDGIAMALMEGGLTE